MSPSGHWQAGVMARRVAGGFTVLTLSAGDGAPAARPGQYASVRIGGPDTSRLLRRALWISGVGSGGPQGGSIDVVVASDEPGGAWLEERSERARIDIQAPLGRPFPLPREAASCLLVGFGASTAPLLRVAEAVVERGGRLRFLLLGSGKPFGLVAARRLSTEVVDRTGTAASVRLAVADMLGGADLVYSAGPAELVREVAEAAQAGDVPHLCALHSPLVCGSGTCTSCALPIRGRDGITRMVRSCAEGPVFPAELVRWADLGTVPADCVGAPEQPNESEEAR